MFCHIRARCDAAGCLSCKPAAESLVLVQMRALPSLARFGTRQASVASSHISLPCRARQSGLIPQVGGGQWRWIRQVQSRALSVVSAAATAEQPQAEEITYQAEVRYVLPSSTALGQTNCTASHKLQWTALHYRQRNGTITIPRICCIFYLFGMHL